MAELTVKILVFGLFPAALVFAAMSDVVSRRIPNAVSGALLVGFLVLALASGMSLPAFGASLGVGALALALGFAMFAIGQMGGGDAKLIAVTMPWFGWSLAALEYAAAFSLIGVVITLPFLLRRLAPVGSVMFANRVAMRLMGTPHNGRETPYGVAIAAGGLLLVPPLARMHGAM